MRFWLDKGVSGFRMDVIPLISKPTGMPDLTPEQLKAPPNAYANGPHLAEYLHEMNRDVLSKYDDMSVGEATGTTLAQTNNLVDDRRHELNMIFNFDAIKLGPLGLRSLPARARGPCLSSKASTTPTPPSSPSTTGIPSSCRTMTTHASSPPSATTRPPCAPPAPSSLRP